MGRRKSNNENLLTLVRDLTDSFWQVGAVASGIFGMLAIFALRWAYLQNEALAQSGVITEMLAKSCGWLLYSMPLILSAFAYFYGVHAYNAYLKAR